MPKDNEVDEKVMPDSAAQDAVSWEGRGSIGGTIGNWHKITRDEYDYHIKNPRLTYEVRALVPAATVAELRAEVASSKLQGELAALEQFLRMASEPVGQECCGQGRYECCGDPIPVFAQPNEVFQAMSDRHAEILASLATLTGADPT